MESLEFVSPFLFRYKRRNFMVQQGLKPKDLDAVLQMDVRPTDICLISIPKVRSVAVNSTVWMQQILAQIMDAAHPDQVKVVSNRERIPFLDDCCVDQFPEDRPDPWVYGTHLPPNMLPHGVKSKRIKVVYVLRNPKDVLVSFYHFAHSLILLETPKSFEDFFQDFLDGNVFMGSWFDHVREYYNEKDQMDILFVKYEDMLKDLRGEVVKLCAFLGKDLTDEAIDDVVESSVFKNMKKNPKANYMELLEKERSTKATMRKGVAGDWKNYFTVALNEYFDRLFAEKMSDLPLSFTWELKQ